MKSKELYEALSKKVGSDKVEELSNRLGISITTLNK
mgnify:CR=1 FL=1